MSRRTPALIAICGGVFLAFLDTTIVNTSFPDIRRDVREATPRAAQLDPRRLLHRARRAARARRRDRRPARAPARVPRRACVAVHRHERCCARSRRRWELLVAARVLQGIGGRAVLSRPRWRCCCRCSRPSGAPRASACGAPPPRSPRRSARRSAALLVEVADWRWIFLVNLPLGALVLARRRAARSTRAATSRDRPARPRRRRARRARPRAARARRSSRATHWGWTSAASARRLRRRPLAARSPSSCAARTPPAPGGRPRAAADPLLPPRHARHAAVRHRLLLDDPRQHPVPDRGLGLQRARRRASPSRPGRSPRRSSPAPRGCWPTASATAR